MSVTTVLPSAMTRTVAVVLVLVTACADPNPVARIAGPSFGKGGTSPTVTTASPAWAYQGTVNLNVTINGSGFDAGSKASWNLNGVPSTKVTVNSTHYVSSSQLTANITVATDAPINNYDVVVTTSTSKQGIGSDAFAVTLAVQVPVVGRGMNMAGQLVGMLAGSTTTSGNLWDPVAGTVSLPNAYLVWGIDETGTTISGKDNNGYPAVWTSTTGAGGPWTETVLPYTGTGGTGRGLANDVNGNALFVSGAVLPAGGGRLPTIWTRTSSGWQLEVDTVPTGVASAWGQSINARGQRVGMDGTSCCYAVYWDSVGAAALLAPLAGATQAAAWSINGDGTVVVGNSNGTAVMWTRSLTNGVYGAWSGAIKLETPSSYCTNTPSSIAYAVNAAGTIAVGESCSLPVAWFISGTTATRLLIGTFGPPNTGTAFAINNLQAPNAAGGMNANGGTASGYSLGAFWKSF